MKMIFIRFFTANDRKTGEIQFKISKKPCIGIELADIGVGGTGIGGTIALSANRMSPATVATITSSAVGNDISISGEIFSMGVNEAMTCLGNMTFSCPTVTLGDLVALDSLTIDALIVHLLIHGDESILNKHGVLYTSPSLHFIAGNGYTQTGMLNPASGPLNAQSLGLSSAEFRPLLILGDPVILNFDTSPNPPPPSPFVASKEKAIYKLAVADAELSDLLPVGPCYEPYKLRHPRCPLPMTYEMKEKPRKAPVENTKENTQKKTFLMSCIH